MPNPFGYPASRKQLLRRRRIVLRDRRQIGRIAALAFRHDLPRRHAGADQHARGDRLAVDHHPKAPGARARRAADYGRAACPPCPVTKGETSRAASSGEVDDAVGRALEQRDALVAAELMRVGGRDAVDELDLARQQRRAAAALFGMKRSVTCANSGLPRHQSGLASSTTRSFGVQERKRYGPVPIAAFARC